MPNESTPAAFESYQVTVDGQLLTILDPEGTPGYRVQMPGDEVRLFVAASGHPCEANAADDIANQPEPVLTADEAEALLDTILDGWAKSWGYASAARCITYVGDPNPQFAAEGLAMRDARSALWTATAAAAQSPDPTPLTDANVRAFAATFQPVRP